MQYLYHYHITAYGGTKHSADLCDAIELPQAIETVEDYDKFKDGLCAKYGFEKGAIIIKSITLLWATNDEPPTQTLV